MPRCAGLPDGASSQHPGYSNVRGDGDDEAAEDDEFWPTDAFTRHDHFGKRWTAINHSLVEYHFKLGAEPDAVPQSERP